MSGKSETNWRWGIIAALAITLLSLYPQLHFWTSSGHWGTGTYVHMEGVGDEVAYSAYVNALMSGRPRRNDPYTGRDDARGQSQPESLFSIQFVPAYLIALPARALGLSASAAFIWLTLIAAFASTLAVFWLLAAITGQGQLAAAGAVFVLCLGTLVSGHGQVIAWFGFKPLYNYLIFLRRYQPSATFPLFFIFCTLVWRMLASAGKLRAIIYALSAGVTFGLLVFSYFYLWTAALAWLGCLALVWLWTRPDGWQRALKLLSVTGVLALAALVPYLFLLSHRAATMEAVEAFAVSRKPDLFRVPELVSVATLLAISAMARRGTISWHDKAVLFAASFALMTFVVFNQQVLTGRSLQPVHYEMFVANYSALLALALAAAVIFRGGAGRCARPFPTRPFPKRALVWIALAAFEWGAYESFVAANGSMEFNRRLERAAPVASRLAEIARSETHQANNSTILATDLLIADGLPTDVSQGVLYAPHMLVFSGVTEAEGKERFYQYLYYTGVDERRLKKILTEEGRYGFATALFGFERAIAGLSENPQPIMRDELDQELRRYTEYCAAFTRERAAAASLSYLVTADDEQLEFSNLDQWYERDAGERLGAFTLYRLKLRDEKEARGPEAVAADAATAAPSSSSVGPVE